MFYEPDKDDHGLPFNPYKSIVVPRPIGWISTANKTGAANLATYSFFNAFNYSPPIIGFSTIGWKDTVANVEATGEFCWNLATRALAEPMNLTCAPAPPDIDEFDVAGLTRAPSRLISAPRVLESPVNFECVLTQLIQLERHDGETVNTFSNAFTYTLRDPVGVVGAIVAWNFPLLLASWKLGPALACGNCVILKPAEQTPLTALRFGELALEAGLPAGVLNIVTGGPETGAALVKHPGVDKIAFTGSTSVGKEIMRNSADTLKRVTLELGGKSPNIVFADSQMDSAVKGALNGIFYGKGEVCCAGSRLFIEKKAEDEFVTKLVEGSKKIRLGDPLDPKTRLGAIVSEKQMQNVLSYIETGKNEGAKYSAVKA